MENATVLRYFSGDILKALTAAAGDITEIRMRAGRPLSVTVDDRYRFVGANGCITDTSACGIKVSADDIRRCFETLCRYSVYCYQNQINAGYITVAGGHRAGLCGTVVYSCDGKIENIRSITGINFRIAREAIGASDEIMQRVMRGGLRSLLVCGQPCSGKTTVLRDLCRAVGDKYPVALVDERGEIAAVNGTTAYNNIGMMTDVYNGYSKPDGIISAVRAMSPRMIICDEIGSNDDIEALKLAASSGIKAAASVHCGCPAELFCRDMTAQLIDTGLFEYVVFINSRRITGIYSSAELSSAMRKADIL